MNKLIKWYEDGCPPIDFNNHASSIIELIKTHRPQYQPRTLETFVMSREKKGFSFFTNKADKDITAIASYLKVKVKTKRLLVIDGSAVKRITKVTIL